MASEHMNKGIWYAIGAYSIWGLFPIYWKWLRDVSALQLLSHRFVWAFLMLSAVIVLARQWTIFAAAARGRARIIEPCGFARSRSSSP